MVKYLSIVLKFFSLAFVIAAGGFWAGAEVDARPKYRDEQTLIGGTVWTQTIIPIGLIISTLINEELYVFVHAYFLFAGVLQLVATGLTLFYIRQKRTAIVITMVYLLRILTLGSIASRELWDSILFIIGELKTMHRRRHSSRAITLPNVEPQPTYDKIYFAIGTLSLLAGLFTLADFIVIIILYLNSE